MICSVLKQTLTRACHHGATAQVLKNRNDIANYPTMFVEIFTIDLWPIGQ